MGPTAPARDQMLAALGFENLEALVEAAVPGDIRMEAPLALPAARSEEQILGDLLPVFDSLDAALAAAGDNGPLREGIELTLRELRRVTANHGLYEIAPAAGDAFNPDLHQAMSVVEAPGVEAGAVAQGFQKGYRLNE